MKESDQSDEYDRDRHNADRTPPGGQPWICYCSESKDLVSKDRG